MKLSEDDHHSETVRQVSSNKKQQQFGNHLPLAVYYSAVP